MGYAFRKIATKSMIQDYVLIVTMDIIWTKAKNVNNYHLIALGPILMEDAQNANQDIVLEWASAGKKIIEMIYNELKILLLVEILLFLFLSLLFSPYLSFS